MSTPSRSASGHLRVLITYAHSDAGWTDGMVQRRREDVRQLADQLRRNGIDADADVYHQNEDWTRWGPRMVAEAEIVLIVASQAWSDAWLGQGDRSRNLGVGAETDAVRSIEQTARGSLVDRCRLVMLPGTPPDQIPIQLHTLTRYHLDTFDDLALEELLRDLTAQPRTSRPSLGEVPSLPPRSTAQGEPGPPPLGEPPQDSPHSSPTRSPVPNPVPWQPLETAVPVTWRSDVRGHLRVHGQDDPCIAAVLIPITQQRVSQRVLGELQDDLVGVLRARHLIADSVGAEASLDEAGVGVLVPGTRRGFGHASPSEFRGCTVARNGQVTVWRSLPRDGMGAVLDRADAVDSLTRCFELAAELLGMVGGTTDVAIAAEVHPVQSLTSGFVAELGQRTGTGMIGAMRSGLRAEPEERLDFAWLSRPPGAAAVAAAMVDVLLRQLGST